MSPVCLRKMTARKSSPFLVRNQGGRARVCARVCVGSWGAKPSPCTTFQPGSASEITHISCELPPQFPRGSRGPSRCSRGLVLKMSLLPFPMIRASESSRTPLPPTHRLALGQSEGRGPREARPRASSSQQRYLHVALLTRCPRGFVGPLKPGIMSLKLLHWVTHSERDRHFG